MTQSQQQLGALGYTNIFSPYLNQTANDLSPEMTGVIQIHELGHSLAVISMTDPLSRDSTAQALVDCVFPKGGR
jgi:hypothetical protein